MEKEGIPCVLESWNDPTMNAIARDSFVHFGVPQCRQVLTAPDTALVDLSPWLPDLIDALTRPLTALEQESGTWQPPIPPRIAMTGTLDEVQTYFQGDLVATPTGGPWAWMTGGGPIIPPTEEAVARMLQGTSHSPDEIMDMDVYLGKSGIIYKATIEKIAVNAVMAGCKPEYMPAVLAIAETGGCIGSTSDRTRNHMYVVSGPYAKEIGMNSGFQFFGAGNPANESLQQAAQLIGINLHGMKYGITNGSRMGGMAWGTTFAENPDTPWDTLNVDFGYDADESVLLMWSGSMAFAPGVQTGIQAPTDLEGLQSGSPELAAAAFSNALFKDGPILIFSPDTARKWKEKFGFDSIQEIQDYIWDNALWTRGEWLNDYNVATKGGEAKCAAREPGTRQLNIDHVNLPDDALVPAIDNPERITIIVAGGSGEAWGFAGGWPFGLPRAISIDDWR